MSGELLPEKALIEGLNYGQVTPETIDCEVKLVKFQPTQAVGGIQPNQQVKFLMNGAGFLDPYSTYLRFTVQVNDLVGPAGAIAGVSNQDTAALAGYEMRFVDGSAHSFINRLYITSNGVEIERIDSYNILAKMINDSLYSTEQHLFHNFEGMPGQTHDISGDINFGTYASNFYNNANMNNNGAAGGFNGAYQATYISARNRRNLSMLLSQGASTNEMTKVGEPCFMNQVSFNAAIAAPSLINTTANGIAIAFATNSQTAVTFGLGGDHASFLQSNFNTRSQPAYTDTGVTAPLTSPTQQVDPLTYDFIANGVPRSRIQYVEQSSQIANVVTNPPNTTQVTVNAQTLIQFTIPLYSSVIGVLMPKKRLIPLGAMPLDIEFTINPYALYSTLSQQQGGSRNFTITRMEMYAHTLFFQQDIPLAVDNIIAASGMYFHMNTFYMAPKTVIMNASLPGVAQIQLQFNAVNSVHFVFMYQLYQTQPCARQLHFVSHNLNYLQINNGIFLVPSEPIQSTGINSASGMTGSSGTNKDGSYVPFFVETIKAWNRLHDPSMDSGLTGANMCSDLIGVQGLPFDQSLPAAYAQTYYRPVGAPYYDANGQFVPSLTYAETYQQVVSSVNPLGAVYSQMPMGLSDILYYEILQKQGNVGRCQYGISLEGEQLGEEKTAITGRKCILPFNVTMVGTKTQNLSSEMWIFLRHDAILHIRPNTSPQLTR